MSDENNKNENPVEVLTQDTPTPEEQVEYKRVQELHVAYSKKLHELNAEYVKEAHFGFAHRTMAVVFTWENGEESNTAPVRAYMTSYPDEFLARSSPGAVFRACKKLLDTMNNRQQQCEEIQNALVNAVPKTSGVIH